MFKTRIPSPDSVEDDLESPFFPDKKNSEMMKWKLIASNLFFGKKKNIYTFARSEYNKLYKQVDWTLYLNVCIWLGNISLQ